jgi:hypothetical protein
VKDGFHYNITPITDKRNSAILRILADINKGISDKAEKVTNFRGVIANKR